MANSNEDDLDQILSGIDGKVYGNSPSGESELPADERTHASTAGQRAARAKRTIRVPRVEDGPSPAATPSSAGANAAAAVPSSATDPTPSHVTAGAQQASNAVVTTDSPVNGVADSDTTAVLGTDGWEHTPDRVEGQQIGTDATTSTAGHFSPESVDNAGAVGYNADARVSEVADRVQSSHTNSFSYQYRYGDAMRGTYKAAHQAPAPQKKPHKGARVAVCAIVAGLAAVYVGGSLYFSAHFLPNTKVGTYDASGMTVDELAQQITTAGQNYTATVSGDNFSLQVAGSDIDYSTDGTTFAQSAKSQYNAWEWPLLVFQSHNYDVSEGVSYDADKLATIVGNAVDAFNQTATAPVNATIQYDSSTQQFSIVDAQGGTTLDKDSVQQAVSTGVQDANSQISLDDSDLQQPTVTADTQSLKDSLTRANQLASSDLTLTYNGTTIVTVPAATFASWFTVDDSGNISGNLETITKWAQGDLSKQYDTVGASRTYTRPDGKQFTVSGGTYGWELNGADLAQNIVNAIQQGQATAEVPMKSTAVNWVQGGQDWGARYIDVDLSEQHARMYDESGNLIWESDFVSGDPTKNNQTPSGVYTINTNKGTNQTLKGLDENGDGQPDYTSQVTYWMPFVDNLVAFHDASWRSSFGGTIYSGNGSHGCVNLPSSAAATLYQLTQVGDVVVVHN